MQETLSFDWDSSNIRHLARHRVSPSEFEEAMSSDPLMVDFCNDTGEERWSVLGTTKNLRLLHMVYTYHGDLLRPITAWDALAGLRKFYFRTKAH